MFKIAICDDEDILTETLKKDLTKYASQTGRQFCFFIYHDGRELLENYNYQYDLIFLDIKMEQLDGFRTAEAIREIDSGTALIFLTSFRQYVWKGYEYRAVNYLVKPVTYSVLKLELNRFFAHYSGKEEKYLCFSNHSGKHKVSYRELCYAETSRRNVLLHFGEQTQEIFKTMKELSTLLCKEHQFAQCHQSFVVNLSYVKDVEKLDLTLCSGEHLPISQPRRKAFLKKLTDYWGDLL